MFETLASKIRAIMSLPDLRKKVIFTIIMCAVARVGTHIPAPGINAAALNVENNSILGMMNMFSGGAFCKGFDFCTWSNALHQCIYSDAVVNCYSSFA